MKIENLLSRAQMREIIGGEIRKSRADHCWNQDYMANKLGITQSAYYKIEAGMVTLTMERLQQIADILEKPITAFLDREKYEQELINEHKVSIKIGDLDLMQKTISLQEKRIEELELKIQRRDKKIDELKLSQNF